MEDTVVCLAAAETGYILNTFGTPRWPSNWAAGVDNEWPHSEFSAYPQPSRRLCILKIAASNKHIILRSRFLRENNDHNLMQL
jgi:hypothetical protein